MLKLQLVGSILLFIACLSCKTEMFHDGIQGDLVLFDSIRVKTPDNFSPRTLTSKHHYQDGIDYLLWHNRFDNSLALVNLTKAKIDNLIQFEKTGPSKVPQIMGATIFSFDSIYLQCDYPGKLFRVDTSGNLLDFIFFSDTSKNSGITSYSQLNSKYFNDLYRFDDNQWLIHVRNPASFKTFNQSVFEFPLFSIINTKEQEVSFLKSRLPRYLVKNGSMLPSYRSSCYNGENLIYSFAGDHNLHVVRDLNSSEEIIEVKSKFVTTIHPFDKYDNPYRYNAESYLYNSILYDSFRNIYYRIVKHPVREISDLEMKEEYNYPTNFSIMVLDSKLNKINEVLFSNTHYSMYNIFPGSNGLYISKSNPKNPRWSEDYLEFDVFEVQ